MNSGVPAILLSKRFILIQVLVKSSLLEEGVPLVEGLMGDPKLDVSLSMELCLCIVGPKMLTAALGRYLLIFFLTCR